MQPTEIAQPIYIVGDVHGQFKKLVKLLQDAQILGDDLSWIAGRANLWFMGDLVDRGPDGIAVIDLVMRLQTEAAAVHGQVASLLGNHELLLLSAYRFGRRSTGLGSNFISRWKQNGGSRKDLSRITLQHLAWLAELPAMACVGDRLLVHADASLYMRYGHSVEEVNGTFRALLKKSDALAWEELLEDFARRGAFFNRESGEALAHRFFTIFGGKQLVHGHTPICAILRSAPKYVTAPLIYANGHCVNVDGGMYLGGPGFIYHLPLLHRTQG